VKKEKVEIKTYRESNYDVVVPFFKVGMVDLGIVSIIFLFSLFSFFFLRWINVLFAQVVMFLGMGVAFVLFLYARRVYQKTGRTNVINDWLDYVLEPEVLEGRADGEKGKRRRLKSR